MIKHVHLSTHKKTNCALKSAMMVRGRSRPNLMIQWISHSLTLALAIEIRYLLLSDDPLPIPPPKP